MKRITRLVLSLVTGLTCHWSLVTSHLLQTFTARLFSSNYISMMFSLSDPADILFVQYKNKENCTFKISLRTCNQLEFFPSHVTLCRQKVDGWGH